MNQKQSNNDPIQVQKIFQETDLLLQISQLFKVFGDVTRLKIITLLYEKRRNDSGRNCYLYGNGTICDLTSIT